MNENIDLTKILKDCPEGTHFYCTICGYVTVKVSERDHIYPIAIYGKYPGFESLSLLYKLSKHGRYDENFDGECILFPSHDQRDWSKFTAPWYKKEKFAPKTLNSFDRVLARHKKTRIWFNDFYSFMDEDNIATIGNGYYDVIIPYNDETKHLVGTTEEAPDYYRYWED